MQAHGIKVDDLAIRFGGSQCIRSDDYTMPLAFEDALYYLDLSYPTDEDLATLPIVALTSQDKWKPSEYSDLVSIQQRLKDFPQSMDANGPIEYDHAGNVQHTAL